MAAGLQILPANPGTPHRAALCFGRSRAAAGGKVLPLDLVQCFISLVTDELIGKRRQEFLRYGFRGGLGMSEFC